MSDGFDKKLEHFKELLENDKMVDTIKMIMNMLEKNKGSDNKTLPATNESKDKTLNSYPVDKDIPISKTASESNSLNQSIDMVMKIKDIYDKVNAGDDNRVNLLMALKPFLSTGRKTHIDTAVKLVNVSKISTILSKTDII